MRIGVIADTHIPRRAKKLPSQVLQGFEGVNLIIHAGDLTSLDVLDQLAVLAPVEAVAGNCDSWEVYHTLGEKKVLELAGFRFGVFHGHGDRETTLKRVQAAFSDVDCVIFGHSHQPYNQWHGQTLYFNPGSPTDKRANPFFSYGIIDITNDKLRSEIIAF